MNFVFYSDSKYEYQVKNFLKSIPYGGMAGSNFYYYTIGFESSISYPGLNLIQWEKSKTLERFEFYKPGICLDSLNRTGGNFIFVDTDIILSKRFKNIPFNFMPEYPIFCKGPIEYPNTFWADSSGKTIFNETKLMKYLGVEKRSMDYIMSCFFTYNNLCSDFFEEWESVCENKYLHKDRQSYFPFTDETVANVLLWKRNALVNYDRGFVNTHKFSTFKLCEDSDDIKDVMIDDNMYEQCKDSSRVYLYHGTKDESENSKILNYIDENS
jgi:hypothetical protein